ncbi:MAG TPA: L,D-transpeptidase/peptidoglycan binding protein [Acidimicrobiales bacterium]|nr:L,D-transpeptidase/peptidoglycan binding protein [Acidimicrobiales bacterium]
MARSVRGALLGVTGVLLLLAVGAGAAVAYDGAHRRQLLPGVTIGGLPAGGRPAKAVVADLDARLPPVGATAVHITAGDKDATVSLTALGLRSDGARAVARAEADARAMGLPARVWHRLLDKPVDHSYGVRLTVDRAAVRRAVAGLAAEVDKKPVDARIDTSSGMVTVLPSVPGRALDVARTTRQVHDAALRAANTGDGVAPGAVEVAADVGTVAPKVTGFPDVILVRLAENKLYHYENGQVVKTYTVATGSAKFPTPKGTFSVVLKRRNPVWVNPDPGGWGKSLPAKIDAGPKNPLGTRAMNLSAPGIRIHGTSNVASLGHSASHGCVRMAMADVEELFDQVDQGTPVVIIQGPPPPPAPGAPPVPATPAPAGAVGDPNAPVDLEAG